jgi:hypothetical protein
LNIAKWMKIAPGSKIRRSHKHIVRCGLDLARNSVGMFKSHSAHNVEYRPLAILHITILATLGIAVFWILTGIQKEMLEDVSAESRIEGLNARLPRCESEVPRYSGVLARSRLKRFLRRTSATFVAGSRARSFALNPTPRNYIGPGLMRFTTPPGPSAWL